MGITRSISIHLTRLCPRICIGSYGVDDIPKRCGSSYIRPEVPWRMWWWWSSLLSQSHLHFICVRKMIKLVFITIKGIAC